MMSRIGTETLNDMLFKEYAITTESFNALRTFIKTSGKEGVYSMHVEEIPGLRQSGLMIVKRIDAEGKVRFIIDPDSSIDVPERVISTFPYRQDDMIALTCAQTEYDFVPVKDPAAYLKDRMVSDMQVTLLCLESQYPDDKDTISMINELLSNLGRS